MSGAFCGVALRQLVFIDCQVPDLSRLVSGLTAGTRAHLLEAGRDALGQMADVLDACGPLDAVHIVPHGAPGELHFASGTLSRASLAHHAAALAGIGAALAPHADVLLWACEAGRGQKGAAFLDALALATGANVAAATHPVGSRALGGSWDLDATVGTVAAGVPFTPAAQTQFAGLLGVPPFLQDAGTVVVDYRAFAAAVAIDPTLTVIEVDSDALAGARVTISAGLQGGDTLHFTNQNGITGSYDPNTGVLTLTGSASVRAYQTALDSITFDNLTNSNPTNFGASATRFVPGEQRPVRC